MSLADSVKNGPRATAAKTAHIEARIKLAEAKGKKAADQAAALRKRAKGDGPLAKSRKLRAGALDAAADRHRAKANELRTGLAKAAAEEAARHAKHVKRTVASTAASGLKPRAAGQGGRPGRAKAGQAKARGGQMAKRTDPLAKETPDMEYEATIRSRQSREWNAAHPNPMTDSERRFWTARDSGYTGWLDQDGRRVNAGPDGWSAVNQPQPKGPIMSTVSGEAVNIEQTRANLDQLKGQVADLRGSFEGISGSLASGGLNQLAGSLASADDALDSVTTQITAAEKHLSDQEAIAEAAQAAGEMHGDKSFYGA